MVNYNLPGFMGTLKLNGTVLAEMYEGKITWWNDPAIAALNPGVSLPRTKVSPTSASATSPRSVRRGSAKPRWPTAPAPMSCPPPPLSSAALHSAGDQGLVVGALGDVLVAAGQAAFDEV